MSASVEEKLVKPSAAKQADQASKPADEKPRFTKSSLKSALKSEDKGNDKVDKPPLRSVRTIDDKAKEKSVTIVDKRPEKNGPTKANSTVNDKPETRNTVSSKDTKPATKFNDKPAPKTAPAKPAPKGPEKIALKPVEEVEIKPIEKLATKPPPTKPEPKPSAAGKPEPKSTAPSKSEPKPEAAAKAETKPTAAEKAVEKSESTEMATKPPTPKVNIEQNRINASIFSNKPFLYVKLIPSLTE